MLRRGSTRTTRVQPPTAAPAAETALLPAGLSFDRIGTVTRVRKDERNVMVQAVTTKPLDEVTVLIQDAVTAAGYRPAGMDNEGFEAEVFFNDRVVRRRAGARARAALQGLGGTSTSSSSTGTPCRRARPCRRRLRR